jgi:methylated-DNA-[protein]-cysteine S-methyltransferase
VSATLVTGSCPSPLGPIDLVADAAGAIVRVVFAAGDYSRFPGPRAPRDEDPAPDEDGRLDEACRQLTEYFGGSRRSFELALSLDGTPFQVAVWRAILDIPYGKRRTYAQVARMVGRPRAARAVGRASALNRLPILVPCHRLVGSDDALHGYAGGLALKRRLLELEDGVVADV